MFLTVIFPHIISPSRRCGTRLALLAVLLLSPACGDPPTTPPPGPQPLTLSCPGNVNGSSVGGQPVALTFNSPTSTGGTAPVAIACNPSSGALFSSGATAVTCTATDSGGRTASCGFSVNVTPVPTITRTRFMAFGDSLTEGKVSPAALVLLDAGPHSYPAQLNRLLSARYTSQALTMANEGRGGERADESMPRFRGAIAQQGPEAILLMHGVNDLNGTAAGRVQAAADAVEELVKEGRNRGAAVFVATLPPFGPGPKASCPECVEPYNALIRKVAAAKGAALVDVHAAWGGRSDLMGVDGIHPTESGYEVIANTFFEAIRLTLESPAGSSR